jgi:uncharacterized membrane protein
MILEIVGIGALTVTSVMAFKYGGRDEQMAAGAFILATLVTRLFTAVYTHTEIGVMAVDLALLAGLVTLALRSDRFWPMWAAAFQLVGTIVHFGSLAETGDFAWAYAIGLLFWSYAVMAALMAGTWLEGRYRER